MPTLLNRTDLLACIRQYGAENLDSFAAALGYDVKERHSAPVIMLQVEPVSAAGSISDIAITMGAQAAAKPHAEFLRVVAHRRLSEHETVSQAPDWYNDAQPFTDNDPALQAPPGLKPPQQQPLMPWPRLWPFLKLALGTKEPSHKTDLPRLVDRIAKGKTLKRLPRAMRKGWASQAQLIIDYDESLLPFWEDFNALRKRLADLRGESGLNVLAFPDGDPGGRCWQDTPDGWREISAYRPPAAGTPVLVLSDLGCNDAAEQRRLRWQRFGVQLVHASCRAVALLPCPSRNWDAELLRLFLPVCWDRHIRPPQRLTRANAYAAPPKIERDNIAAERLFNLLATAVRVEPALLRAVRYLFPAEEMDVGAEFAVWNHPAVRRTHLAFYFAQDSVDAYRQRFRNDSNLTQDLKRRAAALLRTHHAHLSPVISCEEQLAYAALTGDVSQVDAQEFAERLVKTLDKEQSEIASASRQWALRMGKRQSTLLPQEERLAVAWLKAQIKDGLTDVVLPEGLSLEKFAWVFERKKPVTLQIRQGGLELRFSETDVPGSLIGTVRISTELVQVATLAADGRMQSQIYHSDQCIPLMPGQRLTLRTDREELQLDWTDLPDWAKVIGRDEFGFYAELELNDVVQRFRWINPGRFMMGSPEWAAERYELETLHEVMLTQGYWLADSACTQALWIAMMGENPSRFQDDANNPVENVSWDDAQQFIARLNESVPGLHARLPTEAEWEYACRAGTTTLFSFGENITPEQVNYQGNYPYSDGAKGLSREKTVPVKSLPPNPWGLYEMHGNVWEWCADWYSAYETEDAVDPIGPEQGSSRVLRGGSWIGIGRDARSAERDGDDPACRYDFIGFRLALGQVTISDQAVSIEQEQSRRINPSDSDGERIQKVLPRYGYGSRRRIERMIREGRIYIDDKQAVLGDRYHQGDRIYIDGILIDLSAEREPVQVRCYYKPEGQVVSRSDPQSPPTVFEKLAEFQQGRWIAVGTMAVKTQGLLLYTNNGDLANALMHSTASIQCEYAVRVHGRIDDDTIAKLTQGVELEDGFARFEAVVPNGGDGANRRYRITVNNAHSDTVVKILKSQAIEYNRITRTRFADIELPKDLKAGMSSELSFDQVDNLMELAGI